MSIPRRLAIIGSGGHASSLKDAATSAGFTVIGFFITETLDQEGSSSDHKALESLDFNSVSLALGIGTNFTREKVFAAMKEKFPAAQFPPIVHSSAWVSPQAHLGPASAVLAQAAVGPGAHVGVGALINTGGSLDHDSRLGDFASLGPGARTGGNVTIGERVMMGMQSGIVHGRSIGQDTVIGAHSLVLSDVGALSVAMGSPCTVVRSRKKTETYY